MINIHPCNLCSSLANIIFGAANGAFEARPACSEQDLASGEFGQRGATGDAWPERRCSDDATTVERLT